MVFERLLGDEGDDGDDTLDRVAADAAGASDQDEDVASIRRAFSEMGSLSNEQRRFLAGYAYVLVRIARADGQLSDIEIARMESAVVAVGGVSDTQAALLVALATRMNSLYGATEDYAVTREFARQSTPQARQKVLRAAVAVGAIDGAISQAELAEINEVGTELGLHPDEIGAIREQVEPDRAREDTATPVPHQPGEA